MVLAGVRETRVPQLGCPAPERAGIARKRMERREAINEYRGSECREVGHEASQQDVDCQRRGRGRHGEQRGWAE